MKKILSLVTFLALASTGAYAAGTVAGTQIDNSVTLSYDQGSDIVSNTDSFVVDNKIDLTLAHQDGAAVSVQSNTTNQILTFSITNTGNKVQDFLLSAAVNDGNPFGETDSFDATNVRVFVDANNNGLYDAGTDTATYIDELAPDASKTVFIVADMGVQANNAVSEHTLTAQVAQGGSSSSQGSAIASDNSGSGDTAMGVEIVFADGNGNGATDGANDGKFADYSAYKVTTATMSVTKTSCIVSDPVNGTTNPKRIPGATLRYAIEVVNASATTAATNVSVADNLQAGLTYVSGLIGNGACNCASPVASNGDSVTNAGQGVTLNFGNVATSATECGYITATID